MKIGLIGLGNMGQALFLNLLDHGHEAIAWNRSTEKREATKQLLPNDSAGKVVDSLQDLVANLRTGSTGAAGAERIVIISIIKAGEAIDKMFFEGEESLLGLLKQGDIVLDMANSHYQDSKRRAGLFSQQGIHMLDVGISGGVEGARSGACMMVGGPAEAFEAVKETLVSVVIPGGLGHFGSSGAGHFVKMVHNGIEYGMMQSLAEGMNMIEAKSEFKVDKAALLGVWSSGSIIQGNLVKYLQQAYKSGDNLAAESEVVGDNGTGKWVVQEALDLGVPANAIAAGLFARYSSRPENNYLAKVISAMRRVFGGHSGRDRS
jgi:6-phosphogluconate dehydrogenase